MPAESVSKVDTGLGVSSFLKRKTLEFQKPEPVDQQIRLKRDRESQQSRTQRMQQQAFGIKKGSNFTPRSREVRGTPIVRETTDPLRESCSTNLDLPEPSLDLSGLIMTSQSKQVLPHE